MEKCSNLCVPSLYVVIATANYQINVCDKSCMVSLIARFNPSYGMFRDDIHLKKRFSRNGETFENIVKTTET